MGHNRRDVHGPVDAVLTFAVDDTESAAIDVPEGFATANVEVPTIDNASVTLLYSHDGTNFRDLFNTDGTQQGLIVASTGDKVVGFILYGRPSQIKVKTGAAQTADRTFQVSFLT